MQHSKSNLRNLIVFLLAFWVWSPASADGVDGSDPGGPHAGVSHARMSGIEGPPRGHSCCHAGTYRGTCSPLAAHVDIQILVPKEPEPDPPTNAALPGFPNHAPNLALLAPDGQTTNTFLRSDNHPIYLTTLRLRL